MTFMFQTTNQSLTRGEFRADTVQNDKTRGALAPENLLAAVEMTCGRWFGPSDLPDLQRKTDHGD
jgi:hypothetical protein